MSQEDFARQYYAMLQNTMKMISEEQRKQSQIDEIAKIFTLINTHLN